MKKIFSKILTNNSELVLNYAMSLKYEEPNATINDKNISVWWMIDLRNSLSALNAKNVEIVINDVMWNTSTIEEVYEFVRDCDNKVDKLYEDEEEKYNGPKEG